MKNVVIAFVTLVAVTLSCQNALALPQFKTAFAKKYAEKHKDEQFRAVVKKASCNVCHVKGEKKKRDALNHYAVLLDKLIKDDANARTKKASADGGPDARKAELAKVLEELEVAFKKVEKLKSPQKKEEFGKLLEKGELPIDIEWAQAEHKKKKAEEKKEE